MTNEYLAQLEAGHGQQPDNPYLSTLEEERQQRTAALRGSLTQAVGADPEQVARQRRVASYLGYPTAAVQALPGLEQRAKLQQIENTLAGAPKTRERFTDVDFAKLAHDDVANMSAMERIGGGLKATAKYIFSAPDSRNTLMGDIGAGVFMASRGAAGVFRAGAETLAPALDVFERRDIGSADRAPVPFVADLPGGNPLRRLAEGFDRSARAAGAIENQLSPPSVDVVQGGVSSGVKSLVQNTLNLPLAFLPGGQAAYLTAATSSAGGQSYQKAREKGVDPTTALIYGASDAVIEYGTERIPVARLLGDLKAGAPFMQTLLHNAMLEVPGEQAATVLQDLNEWAVVNPDKPFSTYLEERPAAAAQTLIATLVGGGGSVSVGTVIQKAVDNAAGVERDATRAEAHAKVLGEMLTLAEASKVRERDPASFATFMQSLTEEGVPNVYVDAKALLQAVDINEVASVLPSVAEQIEQAAATGGDVVIPTAELLTAGPGQTFMQTLVDNARTAPDAPSPVEAREYMRTKGDQLAADFRAVLSQKEQDQSWRQMRDDLRDEIKAQLDGVKRSTPDVNLQNATLMANFYAATAAKLGQTPQELATRYGLLVQSRGVEGGQVLDQGPALDEVLRGWAAAGVEHAVRENNDRITVSKIVVPEGARGQGAGTAAMRQLLDYADRTGKHVVLSPSADFGGDKGRLTKFYKALGFVENKGKNRAFSTSESMYRQASGKVLQQGKRDDYTLDLFGVPEDKGAGAPAGEPADGRQGAPLFRDDAPGRFATRTEVVEENTRTLGTERVNSPQEAAQAMAYLHKSAVERFDALVTDKDGKPLAVVGAFKGALSQASVYPATVASEAFRIKGAANIWFAHNHPSGVPTLSRGDLALNDALAEVFRGSEIKARGLFAIGGATDSGGRRWNFQSAEPGEGLTAGVAEKGSKAASVPVVERVFADETKLGPSITGPQAAKDAVRALSGDESGVLLMDAQNTPIAFVPVEQEITNKLRGDGRMDALWRAVSLANAGAAIIVNREYSRAQAENLAGFFNAAEVRVLDVMDVNGSQIVSWAETGKEFSDKTFFQSAPLPDTIEIDGKQRPTTNSNGQSIAATEEGVRNFWKWFGDSKVVDDQGRPLVVYHSALDDKVQFNKAGKFMGFTGVSGISVTDSAEMASRYLDRFGPFRYDGKAFEKNVMALYVKSENPLERDAPIPTKIPMGAPLPEGYVSEVEKMGYDALIRNDAISRKGPVKHSDAKNAIRGREIVVFKPENVKSAIGNDGTFDPANPSLLRQGARGSIRLPDDWTRSPAVISLFQGADLSTFIHEAGHFFLEVQMDLAARIQAEIDAGATVTEGERSIVTDAITLLNWFGIKGSETTSPLTEWFALDLEGKRPHHEKFARGFEAYAFEGNAPSLELQSMFQKFLAWMLSVYKDPKALRVELTDDVRGVMDRMLASTQAIQEAEAARRLGPLFKTAEEAGMSLDDFRAYHALATDASQAAIEELQARGLRDMKWLEGAKDRKLKELQKLHDSLRREVRAEVRREVMSQPVYRAWQFLTGKGEADETAQAPDKPKASKELDVINDDLLTAVAKLGGLNKAQAVSEWGIDPKEKPDSGVFGTPVLRANGGLSIDAMAERLLEAGYLLPDENGKHDTRDFEERFDAALRGESIYSLWHDYKRPDDDAPVQALPEGIAFGKLDTAELERRYGNKPDAPWRKLQKLRMASGARGLHPDVIAETVRMESGDQMVKALLDAEPPLSVIEGMTNQRMLERFGDLGTPEGLQRAVDRAIHNEVRARLLSTEIAALERGMQVRRDTGEVNAKGRRVTVDIMAQVAKQQAERIVGGTKVKNLRPSQYTTAATRAAKAAERAMLAGNTEEALAEKRHQLINLQAVRAATRAREEVEKIASYLRRFNDKPKGLDADYYDQIAQLLGRFDLAGSTTLKQIAKRKTLAAWVESQREQGLEPDIPPELLDEANRTSYKDMTVDELRGLRDTVRQIEKLGRVKNTLLTAKQKRDFQGVRDLISDSILENAGGRVADTRTPATRTARWFKAVEDFGAAHIKAATWARVLDGGKDGGLMWEYFIRPANEAADMETRMRAEATERLHGILAPVIKAGRMDGKGQFFATINRSMNREQVFAMALNMGNMGNIQRMLDGEGWTLQQIEPVLATLSAADLHAVQAVWDHFESYRTLIGAKERRIYGKEPAWVAPMPLSVRTADGQIVQLRGGYYPVRSDPLANNRAEQHADAEDAKRQMQAAYTSATTRRGFTKSRAEAVKGRPLLYSLAAVYSGTQDVIHDLAFHEWLIDVNKLLRSDKINDAIRETYGPSAVRQLKTWIEDTARGEAGLQAEMDSMLGRLRQGVSLAGLGFNVMSAALQPIGLTQSVVRVGGKWIGRGVAQYLANPLGKAREVNERSEFMANRARTRFRELNELRNQVEGEHPVRTWVSNAAFYMMTRMQMAADVPTWLGAYEKAISEGNSDERAGQLADQAVIDSQGGGQVKDLSAIERGGPAQKLFTVFYSFMNTSLNVGVAQTMTEKSKAKLVADYLLLYSVPAVLTAALKDALVPGDSGDWEDLEGILRKLLEAQLDNLFGLMVGVREVAGAAKMALGLSEYAQDYRGPAGLRLLDDITGLGKEIGQGELDDGFRKRAINVLGDAFGLPAAQANRTITGAQALLEGETDNPAALAFGYQRP